MTAVYCFSGSGHSRAVAAHFAEKLHTDVLDLGEKKLCSAAVVVFPVYCENVPEPVKAFLPRLDAKYVVLIATYGRMGHGNVLAEAGKLVRGQVIAGAYVPTGHTYLKEGVDFDSEGLAGIFERIGDPRPALIPRQPKHVWADFFPAWRSRIGVKIARNENCGGCNLCGARCPMGAIRCGQIGPRCIRCLRCVYHCPRSALTFRLHPALKRYLSTPREEGLKVYL